jgi:hypothetical protein
MTRDEAVALYESQFWKTTPHEDIAKFQLMADRLCVPFKVFHEALEKALGRPVFTHEFGLNREGMIKELFHGAPAPTWEEIINLLPKDKRIILAAPERRGSE